LLGEALHPLQDATSPSHAGFQVWSGHEDWITEGAHVNSELIYPGINSNLQNITNKILDLFQNKLPLPSGNLFNGIKADPDHPLLKYDPTIPQL
jgi:hypothetical protein